MRPSGGLARRLTRRRVGCNPCLDRAGAEGQNENVGPDFRIRRCAQVDLPHMRALWIFSAEPLNKCRTEIGVEEKLHATELARRRSRAAANA